MEPLVSVVIATRDRPQMLREAIKAVIAQKCVQPLEVIVVYDQHEPDFTIAECGTDAVVLITRNTRTPGLAGARNTGILMAKGRYVAFCDDDDYWLPGKLHGQLQTLEMHPGGVLATCGIRVEYGEKSHDRTLPLLQVDFSHLAKSRLTELHPSTFLFTREKLIHQVGLVDEALPGGFGEDYDLLLRTAKVGTIHNISTVGVVVRWGSQSFFFRRWATMAEGLRYVKNRHPEIAISRRGTARIIGQIAFADAAREERALAWKDIWEGLTLYPLEPRLLLAALINLRIISPNQVMASLHRFGRGI